MLTTCFVTKSSRDSVDVAGSGLLSLVLEGGGGGVLLLEAALVVGGGGGGGGGGGTLATVVGGGGGGGAVLLLLVFPVTGAGGGGAPFSFARIAAKNESTFASSIPASASIFCRIAISGICKEYIFLYFSRSAMIVQNFRLSAPT